MIYRKDAPEEEKKHILKLFEIGMKPSADELEELYKKAGCDSQCKFVCKTSYEEFCPMSCILAPGNQCGTCLTNCEGCGCKDAC
jgi:hypothetical protein